MLRGLRRRVRRLPVEGARLAGRSSSATATTPTRSPRPPSWRPTRRRWRRSSTRRTRRRCSTTPATIADATDDGELLPLPDEPVLGWEPDPDIGELAAELDQSPELYRALRPEALATLTYMAGLVTQHQRRGDAAAGDQRGPRPRATRTCSCSRTRRRPSEYSLHTTGWSFDIRRDYESRAQAEAFQYVLDRLRALALIDYAVEPGAIHVTVSNLGGELLEG